MKTSTIVIGIIVVLALIGGGYWWMHQTPSATTDQTATDTTTPANTSTYIPGNLLLGTDATSTLGTYLIASNGMTLYSYSKDTAGVSNCTGQCAVNWPPYTVDSKDALANVQAGIGGDVEAITRADGTMQVTYKGAPLYFYIKDTKSGDTTGQNVGSVWFVVKP